MGHTLVVNREHRDKVNVSSLQVYESTIRGHHELVSGSSKLWKITLFKITFFSSENASPEAKTLK